MIDKNKVIEMIYCAIDDYNSVVEKSIALEKTENTLHGFVTKESMDLLFAEIDKFIRSVS